MRIFFMIIFLIIMCSTMLLIMFKIILSISKDLKGEN